MGKRLLALLLLFTLVIPEYGALPITTPTQNTTSKDNKKDTTKSTELDISALEKFSNNIGDRIVKEIYDKSYIEDKEGKGVSGWPVIITGDKSEKPVMRGTIIRSLNNSCLESTYKPKYKDVDFLKDRVIKDFEISTVYTGQYDIVDNSKTSKGESSYVSSRETNILGEDMLTYKDEWDKESSKPDMSVFSPTDNIIKSLVIMDCFKILGQDRYYIYMKQSPNGDKNIPVADTPFTELVSSNDINIASDTYYTDIYISRTVPEDYWNLAKKDGIVTTDFEEYKKGSESKYDCNQTITLGELAYYMKSFMYLNGEPVMTDKEEQALLVAYGRTLPTYLPSQQLDAVKYLMARGILDKEEDFNAPITGEKLLTYLMRAKDPKSRLTFKTLEIDYNKDLVAKGYYPTEVNLVKAEVSDMEWNISKADVKYYDYFIKVTDQTTFRNSKGQKLSNLYVSSKKNSTSISSMQDSQYLGIENGYYHFVIPIDIGNEDDIVEVINNKKYITINSTNDTDTPGNIKVEYGGGWYNSFEEQTSRGSEGCYISNRLSFMARDLPTLVDIDRKLSAQMLMRKDDFIPLTNNNKTTLTCTMENPTNFRWYGYEIGTDDAKKKGAEYDSNSKKLTITIDSGSSDPWKFIKNHLTTYSENSSVKFPAYMNSDDTVLVPTSYLKGLETPVDVVNKGDGTYILNTRSFSIYVNTNNGNKKIVSGQCLEQIADDDKSPLVVAFTDGEYLIDCRALKGIINNYLPVSNNNSGVKTIMTSKRKDKVFEQKIVIPVIGSATNTYVVSDANDDMLLEASYAKSNFLIYKLNKGGIKEDFLLVFKPKTKGIDTSDAIKKELGTKFGIKLGASQNCSIYRLGQGNEINSTAKNESSSPYLSLGDCIKHSQSDGYTYKIPDINNWGMSGYYLATNPNTPLPIVKAGGAYLDLNSNIIGDTGVYSIPGNLMNDYSKAELNVHDGLAFNSEGNGYYNDTVNCSEDVSVQYAPIGLYLQFFEAEKITLDEVKDKKNKVLFGTMAGEIEGNTSLGSGDYVFKSAGLSKSVQSSYEFYKLNSGSLNGSVLYLYNDPDASQLGDFKDNNKFGKSLHLGEGLKNLFDWDGLSLKLLLTSFDDLITLINIVLLNIIPKIMIIDFLALASLSLVARYPIVEHFCLRVIDPYKILSLGALDVLTIRVKDIWISTFWAIVLLGMLNNQSLTDIFAFMNKSIQAMIDY